MALSSRLVPKARHQGFVFLLTFALPLNQEIYFQHVCLPIQWYLKNLKEFPPCCCNVLICHEQSALLPSRKVVPHPSLDGARRLGSVCQEYIPGLLMWGRWRLAVRSLLWMMLKCLPVVCRQAPGDASKVSALLASRICHLSSVMAAFWVWVCQSAPLSSRQCQRGDSLYTSLQVCLFQLLTLEGHFIYSLVLCSVTKSTPELLKTFVCGLFVQSSLSNVCCSKGYTSTDLPPFFPPGSHDPARKKGSVQCAIRLQQIVVLSTTWDIKISHIVWNP